MATVTRPAAVPRRRATALTQPVLGGRLGLRFAKRAIDVVVGSLLALVMAPVMLALATVLATQMRTWPFFVHDRLGRHGRLFRCPKLRTLQPDTPCYADKITSELRPASRLAAFLRARHLDEMPQLLLVPLGGLSLVGPRPKMPDIYEPIDPVVGRTRTMVRQGCTGLWQIAERNGSRVADFPQYDLFYLRYGSLRMDLWILWRTVVQAFGGRSVTLRDVPRWTLGRGVVTTERYEIVDLAMDASLTGNSQETARTPVNS